MDYAQEAERDHEKDQEHLERYHERQNKWIDETALEYVEKYAGYTDMIQDAMVNMCIGESELLTLKREQGRFNFIQEWDKQFKAYFYEECKHLARKRADGRDFWDEH